MLEVRDLGPCDKCTFPRTDVSLRVRQSLGAFLVVVGTGRWDWKFEWGLVAEVKESVCSAWDLSRVGTRLALKRLEWPYLLA